MNGKFITLEGGEGSGKSTQTALLKDAFGRAGLPLVVTREPGGTPGAEQIRGLLVSGSVDAWDAASETLLFYAARRDHLTRLIKPALAKGKTVLCDRFADSTMVYQGAGKGLSMEYLHSIHRLTLGNLTPDLTIILDIAPEEGLKRAGARRGTETRFEEMDICFHRTIRQGFLDIAKAEPARCAVLDATQDEDALHAQIISLIKTRLGIAL